jgi:hypothetical protein
MQFHLNKSLQILERTPAVLIDLLKDIDEDWTMNNEGDETWSAYDIIGHLIHGEHTDWIPRLEIILNEDANKNFTPFDRFAQFKQSEGKNLNQLLKEFKMLREENLKKLKSHQLKEEDFDKTGIHPYFGAITMRQLLSTWTIHDLSHIAQISRVMAKQYKEAIGPWTEFFRMMQ